MKNSKKLYAWMSFGAALGVVAAFWQTLEKLTLIKNKDAVLQCNISKVFSCSNVLNSHQASVFGFPNSIMCLILFVIFLSVALVGLTGGAVSKKMRLSVQGLSLFTLGFALWFLYQSTYNIGAICIFCVACFTGLLIVNWAWLRLNVNDISKNVNTRKKLNNMIKTGADLFIWIVIALVVVGAILFQFYI